MKFWKMTNHHKIVKQVIKKIPQESSLSTERQLAVHVAERHELYVYDDRVNDVDYILYDFYAPTIRLMNRTTFDWPFLWPDNNSIRSLLNNQNYGAIHCEDGVCLFEKGADHESGLQILAFASEKEIQNSKNIQLAENIYVKGIHQFEPLSYYTQPEKFGPIFWHSALHFTCYWISLQAHLEYDRLLFIFQQDDEIYFMEHIPVFGVYPMPKWDKDKLIRDEIFWEVPEKAKAGVYHVSVALLDEQVQTDFVHLFDVEVRK